jgi:hypothetical protein
MPSMIEIIKTAAIEAVAASNPAAVLFGTVKSVDPLKIQVEQKLILEEAHLMLTSLVSDFDVDLTMDHETQEHTHTHTITDTYSGGGSASNETHKHSIVGDKTVTVNLGLTVGETVIMLKVQGGQKYIVLDRVR